MCGLVLYLNASGGWIFTDGRTFDPEFRPDHIPVQSSVNVTLNEDDEHCGKLGASIYDERCDKQFPFICAHRKVTGNIF